MKHCACNYIVVHPDCPGPSRRTSHLSRRSSHPVWQLAHTSCHLQHHSWRRPAPHHRHHSPTCLQTKVTWERPHFEAPADADGQSGVSGGSGVQGRWVRPVDLGDETIINHTPKEHLICSCIVAPSVENWCFDRCLQHLKYIFIVWRMVDGLAEGN